MNPKPTAKAVQECMDVLDVLEKMSLVEVNAMINYHQRQVKRWTNIRRVLYDELDANTAKIQVQEVPGLVLSVSSQPKTGFVEAQQPDDKPIVPGPAPLFDPRILRVEMIRRIITHYGPLTTTEIFAKYPEFKSVGNIKQSIINNGAGIVEKMQDGSRRYRLYRRPSHLSQEAS